MTLLKQVLERMFDADILHDTRCADVLFEALKTTNKNVNCKGPQDVALECVSSGWCFLISWS